jgi:glycosyltransferase involved in cell wall biosynthesis
LKPLVSIIIPIYKVERYLEKCINTILNQTLTEIEIILINDRCPNGCGLIADKYKKLDERVVVIHQENKGQSSARNRGIEISKGEFIGFVDPDDWIEPYMYEKLYKSITSSDADVAICGRRTIDENGEIGTVIEPNNREYDFNHFSKSKIYC